MTRKNLIIDGNNLLYAAVASTNKYFKNNPNKERKLDQRGIDVDSLQSFLFYLNNLVKDHLNELDNKVYVYVAWDRRLNNTEPSWRKVIYPAYKENRKSEDGSREQLAEQVKNVSASLKMILSAMGIYSVFPYTSEGDDIINYLIKKLEGENIIFSADKDFYQCINENTSVYNFHPKNSFMVTTSNWDEHVEVSPENFVKYKAIMGDSSDNISGIYGYGPKKTQKLLNDWETESLKLNEEQLEEIQDTIKIVDLNYKPLEKKEILLVEKQILPLDRKSDWEITKVFSDYQLQEDLVLRWQEFLEQN